MQRIMLAVLLVLSLAAAAVQTSFADGQRSPATSYVAAPTPTPMAGIQKHG